MQYKLLVKYSLYIFIVSIILFTFFVSKSVDAGLVFLSFEIIFGIFVLIALQSKNSILIGFTLIAFCGHVLGTPFFILNKNVYTYSGWTAVKNFDFSLIYLFSVYSYCFISLLIICLLVWLGDKAFLKKLAMPTSKTLTKPYSSNSWYIITVVLLIICSLLSIVMHSFNIGISGIQLTESPFKIVGILTYTRSYILPIIILFSMSKIKNPGLLLIALLSLNMITVALTSSSRFLAFTYLIPLIIIVLSRISMARLLAAVIITFFSFWLPSATREFIETDSGRKLGYLEILGSVASSNKFSIFDVVSVNMLGAIASRLYGAQDLILTYQYEIIHPFGNFLRFVMTGSPIYLVEDAAYNLYGLEFDGDKAFGVGIGVIGQLVALGRSNIFVFLMMNFYISFIIIASNRILINFFRIVNLNKVLLLQIFPVLVISFLLISADFKKIYIICLVLFWCSFFLKQVRKISL
jgi:hypothetical protein